MHLKLQKMDLKWQDIVVRWTTFFWHRVQAIRMELNTLVSFCPWKTSKDLRNVMSHFPWTSTRVSLPYNSYGIDQLGSSNGFDQIGQIRQHVESFRVFRVFKTSKREWEWAENDSHNQRGKFYSRVFLVYKKKLCSNSNDRSIFSDKLVPFTQTSLRASYRLWASAFQWKWMEDVCHRPDD